MTIAVALKQAEKDLEVAKITGGHLDSQLLLAHVLGNDRGWLLAHDDEELSPKQQTAFAELIAKRIEHIPVVHLTNTREFYGLDLYITDQVLTPRIETETMAAWAIELAPQKSRLIDIGTGSGALAVAIARERLDLNVSGTEISAPALDVAKRNAERFELSINFIQSDLFEHVSGTFTTVVTNLPYLKSDADLMPEVRREPAVALFGGDGDGLELYRRFLAELPHYLESRGYLFTECDPWQQPDLIAEAKAAGLELIRQDYFILGFQRV